MSNFFSEKELDDIKSLKPVALYFKKTKKIAELNFKNDIVTMNFFQRKNNIYFCGNEIIIDLLKSLNIFKKLKVEGIADGTKIKSLEPVLKITGPYSYFGWLEGLIDSILTRQTNIYNNAKLLLNSTNSQIIAMSDRSDLFINQKFDGFAMYKAGIKNFVTEYAIDFFKNDKSVQVVGTMPHALIQMTKGDLIQACETYINTFKNENLTALIDFSNNCVQDAKLVAKHFQKKLWAVRIDTGSQMVDKFFNNKKNKLPGVNGPLINAVRKELDLNGCIHTKIIVSSSINSKKIKSIEKFSKNVDFYGIGQSLLKLSTFFTGDCVKVNESSIAKEGRKELFSKNLKHIN